MRLRFFFRSRWLIVAPALLASIFSFIPSASADPAPGLFTSYYTIDVVPPVMSDSEYVLCGSEVENNINRSYDGEPYLDCTNDLFMVHMTGFITIPEHNTIEFWLASDDGGIIDIGGNEWGNWGDQGCSATESGQIDISAGSQPLDLFMYENGGGTCLMLAWNINNEGWSMVPDEAFTTNGTPTTTTTSTTTTSTTTTTTIPETTTTSTTTSTTTTSTTTTSTTTTQAPPPATVAPPPATVAPPPATTTSTTSTTSTTTTQPPPPETVPPPPTTMPAPPETIPEPPATLPAVLKPLLPPTTSTMPEPPATIPTIPLPPDTMPPPPDTLPEAPQAPETSQPAKDAPLPPISDKAVVEALANIEQATVAEVKAIVTELLTNALTTNQAVSVASEPAVLEVLTNEEAAQGFEQVAVEELSTEQAVELVAAVQEAPTKVRKAFEAVLNLFEGFADDYTMTNQTVPIKTRRALIALSAVFLVSAPAPIRRNTR